MDNLNQNQNNGMDEKNIPQENSFYEGQPTVILSAMTPEKSMPDPYLADNSVLPEGVVDWATLDWSEEELNAIPSHNVTVTAYIPENEPTVIPSAENAPQSVLFSTPYVENDIGTDENAVAFHGMTHPTEPQPDYRNFLYEEEDPAPHKNDLTQAQIQEVFGDEAEFQAEKTGEGELQNADPKSKQRPVRKGRPKRKKGDGLLGIPHLLSTAIWLAIIVMIGVSLGRLIWVCAADVLAFGREDRQVTITVETNDTIESISDKLYRAGLIRYPGLFQLYASLTVDEGEISTGTFTLNTLYDYHALVGGMSSRSSYRAVIEDVVIPEGYSCRQIFELLEEKGICTVAELEEYAANGVFADYWFLEDVQRGDKYCLEGFLFPDTYDFYEGSTPREALGKMLTGFEYRVTEEMAGKLTTLNQRISKMMRDNGRSEDYIASHQLTFRDVVIVASLIEKETGNNAESYKIASVIYNRLYDWGNNPAYLNIDAATIYAMGGDASNIDNTIDHPYNTYQNTGLTPGPISNPGLASIEAALNPADTDYYFYVLNPATGQHTFSKTREEHEKLVEQYRQSD